MDQHQSVFTESEPQTTSIFDQFQPVDVSEVITLVWKVPQKSCELDPFPSKVLLKHLNTVAPLLTDIINELLTAGVFPENLKEALLRRLLKKNGPGFNFIELPSCIKPIPCLKAHGMGGMSTNHHIC